jgi:hypothetical protein
MKRKSLMAVTLTAMVMLVMTSCKKENGSLNEEAVPAQKNAQPFASVNKMKDNTSQVIQSVRKATSRFHSTQQAIAAGYLPTDECVSVPGLGGMGFHWVNPNLVDPVFDPMNPEAVLYATGPGGQLKLIAVEYIVINAGQPAPMFGTQAFMVGGTPVPAPHWSLHAWLYEENPSGMFAPFNPNVSCQ